MWPPKSLLQLSSTIAAHVAIQESRVTIKTYCGPCGHPRVSCNYLDLLWPRGHPICDDHMGYNVYRGHMSRTVWQLDTMDIIPSHSDGPYGPQSRECGHTGLIKYRYFHETLRWPHGLQWALIFAWPSWMTTWAATDIWNCTSLLHGHMGHSCCKIDMKMRWPHGLNCV